VEPADDRYTGELTVKVDGLEPNPDYRSLKFNRPIKNEYREYKCSAIDWSPEAHEDDEAELWIDMVRHTINGPCFGTVWNFFGLGVLYGDDEEPAQSDQLVRWESIDMTSPTVAYFKDKCSAHDMMINFHMNKEKTTEITYITFS
jgi:hypothetical protein